MTHSELTEYLTNVCDAENAIFCCNEYIMALKDESKKISLTPAPTQPIKTLPEVETKSDLNHINLQPLMRFIGAVVAFFSYFGIIRPILNINNPVIELIPLALLIFLGAYALGFIWKLSVVKKDQNRIDQINYANAQKAEIRYQNELTQYNQDMIIYGKIKETENQAKAVLQQEINRQSQTMSQLTKLLDVLYQRNIIHVRFRNIIAVNQIKEYIDMGLCTTLEGPNGAYAQYLQDEGVRKICTSIDEMKKSVVESIHTLSSQLSFQHSSIIREIRESNNNVQHLRSELSSNFDEMHSLFLKAQQQARNDTSAMNTTFSLMNDNLNKIQQSASNINHNQYIALRKENIKGYLLRS